MAMTNDPDEMETCPVCAGCGYVVEDDGARDWCDECGASGEVLTQRALALARARMPDWEYCHLEEAARARTWDDTP